MIFQIQPWIDHEEMVQLQRVVDSTFVTEAGLTAEFEALVRQLTGARHALAITNGTLALYAILKAMGIVPGDEVIVPDLTFIATANAVIMAGGTPVFCDVRPDTLCLDVESARGCLSPRTVAIMPVHLYGQSADMDSVGSFAREAGIAVVEDAAQGVGVRFRERHTGTFGRAGILSFYGNKTITCGEGGVILTDDDELAQACYRLKNHGRDTKGVFVHEHVGFNLAFTEMQAAIGIAQMGKLSRIIARKRQIHDRYVSALSGIPALRSIEMDQRTSPVHWFTSFLCENCEGLAAALAREGIQTRRFFWPLHLQPCYRKDPALLAANQREFPVATDAYQRGLSLPSAYLLTDHEQAIVIEAIRRFHGHRD